jgi:hypothetical protein
LLNLIDLSFLEELVLLRIIVVLVVFLNLSFGMADSVTAQNTVNAQEPDAAALTVLSFKEWKQEKASQTQSRFSKLESEYIAKKASNPTSYRLKSLYNELKDTKSHLDEIQELQVPEYFQGYLSRFKDQKKAFKTAAAKLDSSEVADLMAAYADSLLKTSGEGISTSPPGISSEASK